MPYMPSRSPSLRNYLDRRNNPYGVGNRYGAGLGTPQPPGGMQPMGGRSPFMSPTPVATRNFPTMFQPSGAPTPGAPPTGGLPGFAQGAIGRFQRPQAGSPTMTPLSPEDAQRYVDLDRSLYGIPDYEGRHEANEQVKAAYLRMLQRQAGEGAIDYSGSSAVADQFENQRAMLQNQLAARGISGSGVEAGALANSYGGQAKAMGQFYRDAQEQRRRERLAEEMGFENYARQIGLMGLQRNWGQQDEPGFLGDVMGVIGGVAGSLIPDLPFLGGGNSREQQPQQQMSYGYPGQQSIYGPPQYPYVDELNDPWSPFYQGGRY